MLCFGSEIVVEIFFLFL
jgi:hypothetical protein